MAPGIKTGGRQKGTRNKETLLKEERRRIFDEEASKMWLETIRKLPPTYVADQFMGKALDKVEHSGEIKTGTPIPAEAIAIIEADLLKQKTNDKS